MPEVSTGMLRLAVKTAHELDSISWVYDWGGGRHEQEVGVYEELTEQQRDNLEVIVLPNGLRFKRMPPIDA